MGEGVDLGGKLCGKASAVDAERPLGGGIQLGCGGKGKCQDHTTIGTMAGREGRGRQVGVAEK